MFGVGFGRRRGGEDGDAGQDLNVFGFTSQYRSAGFDIAVKRLGISQALVSGEDRLCRSGRQRATVL